MNSTIQNHKTSRSYSKIVKTSLLTLSLASLLPAAAFGNNRQPAPELFDDFGIQQVINKNLPPKAVKDRNRIVNVHTDILDSDTLTLNLFNDVIATAVRDRIIDNVQGKSTITWIGHIEGEQDSGVFLTARGNTLSGTVQIGNKTYEIATKGNSLHYISQVNPDNNPKHSHPKLPRDSGATGGQITTAAANSSTSTSSTTSTTTPTTSASTTGTTVINVLVVYTPKALSDATSVSGIETKITNAVAMANQAYINSGVPMQINLVGMAETQYAETGDMNVSLAALQNPSDGQMDDVPLLRSQLGADQVSLVSADTNYCGLSYIMSSGWVSSAFAPYAYSVVHDDSVYACLTRNTLAHELGHNQGNQHDAANASSQGAYSYSYGNRLCATGGFETVMAYPCSGATLVGYFSSPNVFLSNGLATGTSTANNALSMTNTAPVVASFMSAPSTIPNAPSNLSASAMSSSQVSLTWTDNSSNETGFMLQRSADGINWSQIAQVGSNVVSYTDSGLTASSTYYYQVSAYNSAGYSSYSNTAPATTAAAAIDTTQPTVTISKPGNGAKVSGIVGVSVSASDNVAVSSLQLSIDGKVVSSGNVSSLSYNWNTKKVSSGTHTISAQATDPSGNVGTQSISVTK